MPILVVGLDHLTAPLDLLERTRISESHLPKMLTQIADDECVDGAVVLSTCNRTEVYASATAFHDAHKSIKKFLSEVTFVGEEELDSYLYSLSDSEVVSHLFRYVVVGRRSMVLGEPEIQGQVKRAWNTAMEEGFTDFGLNNLFRHALEAGKRVRSETYIPPLSVSDVAVELVEKDLGTLQDVRAVVLGTGEMGRQICELLAKSGAGDIATVSRTFQHAEQLAESFNAENSGILNDTQTIRAAHLDEIANEIVSSDVLFSSTGAPSFLLDYSEMQRFMKMRAGRPLLVMDIAVPRDIDPTSAEIEGLSLKNIDDVGSFVRESHESNSEELDRAYEILSEEVTKYESRLQISKQAPLITEFRRRICDISQDEFDRYRGKLRSLEPSQRETVEELVRSIVNKVLHNPTMALQKVDEEKADILTDALEELFQLNEYS